MTIFLAGGGPDPDAFPDVFDAFAAEVRQHAGQRRPAHVAVAVHGTGVNLQDLVAAYAEPLQGRIDCRIVVVPLAPGKPADPATFDGVDGVVVGGGLTPGYWEWLHPAASAIPNLVTAGVPYLGFSAGAMMAPRLALIGGYRIDGVEVCGEECSEGLDSVDLRKGLGLVPFTVDVHAAQAGTLSRALGAVAAGLAERAVAIDENTAVVVESAGDVDYKVIGAGNCWDIRGTGGAATSVSVLKGD
ncbi:Type 1 glutamine amidotransferase-like domain-containing protein [Arthrobacter sp. FW306-07-I]|uniref:Type 1 glutamine amidotransferase-like domain-containing protein n=1 Tax=Arthrobacter sp. FW306-07-I TaxID=2879622 RepID=UPI001F0075DA|nr:Type 1 glutamine amidotransferase-like domain-containing protein [Arthrobacter sp. FW306-07-I]UKA74902.1 Type 1 glutamine amidotransferase-like domain-containing protein [Arthrobacter sp. FW306-07-I]